MRWADFYASLETVYVGEKYLRMDILVISFLGEDGKTSIELFDKGKTTMRPPLCMQ